MPSTRKRTTKDGTVYYQILVSRGRGVARPSFSWYPPSGWSQKAIERELVKVAAEFERAVKAGEVVTKDERIEQKKQQAIEDAKIQTLKQYCEAVYMPVLAAGCSENSRESYQSALNTWIYPALGDFKFPDITPVQIEALFTSMQLKKKAHGTIIKTYTVLSGVFKKARKAGLISANPMDLVDRPKPRKDENKSKDPDFYTAEELQYILECIEKEPFQWYVFTYVLAFTGMRRGECCGLEWSNIDFQNNIITICQTLNYTATKGVYIDTTKNRTVWQVNIDPFVANLLQRLRLEQAKTCISRFVFTQQGSAEPIHPQSPTRYFKKLEKRYNIPEFHPHKLRHTFASVAITNGADIASISEILGHSDKAITLKMYTHADQESKKRASNVFLNAVKKAPALTGTGA